MPKINTIDAKTGLKTGSLSEQSGGRVITAKTNSNPTQINVTPKVEELQPQGQPNKSEASPEVKQLSPQHEALAKKESTLRAREREFQAKEAALESRIKQAVEDALGQYKGRLKQAPLDVLNEEGLTYDQLVEQAVNAPDPTTRAIQQKIDSIEANQKKFVEDSTKAAQAQREAAIKQIKYDVQELIETDTSFETIKATESTEDVVNLITRTFDESGKLLTVDQAAKMVEDELFEEAIKIANLSKVKSKLTPGLTPELVKETKQQEPVKQATTLTNKMSSSRPMTARERAIARFKGESF